MAVGLMPCDSIDIIRFSSCARCAGLSVFVIPDVCICASLSVFKGAASCELAEQAGGRYLVAGHAAEIAEELTQATGLGILHLAFAHLFEDRHHLVAYDTELIEQGAVEGGIGQFLEREYPLLFTGSYAGAAAYGIQG